MSAIKIRPAVSTDVGAITELGRRMRSECLSGFPPVDADAIADSIAVAAANPDRVFAFVACEGGAVVGMSNGAAGSYPFSRVRRASCDVLYVAPESRGRVGVCLLREAVRWARERQAAHLYVGLGAGIDLERTGRLLEKLGFAPLGAAYRKEIDICAADPKSP